MYIHPTQAFNEKACCMPELPSPLTQCPGQEHHLAMETQSKRPLPWLVCLPWTPQCLPPSHRRSFPQRGQSDQGWLENRRKHKTTLVVTDCINLITTVLSYCKDGGGFAVKLSNPLTQSCEYTESMHCNWYPVAS